MYSLRPQSSTGPAQVHANVILPTVMPLLPLTPHPTVVVGQLLHSSDFRHPFPPQRAHPFSAHPGVIAIFYSIYFYYYYFATFPWHPLPPHMRRRGASPARARASRTPKRWSSWPRCSRRPSGRTRCCARRSWPCWRTTAGEAFGLRGCRQGGSPHMGLPTHPLNSRCEQRRELRHQMSRFRGAGLYCPHLPSARLWSTNAQGVLPTTRSAKSIALQ